MKKEEIKTVEEAKEFIIKHLKECPDLHCVPDNLINTYSGMFGHPIRYCNECRFLIDKFQIGEITGIKRGMWCAYYEEAKHEKT